MRARGAHVAHIIKQADESRAPTVAYADDAELFAPLQPSTVYTIRIMLFISGTSGSTVWRPHFTQPVDHACIWNHRAIATSATEIWFSASASNHNSGLMDTARVNDGVTAFHFSADGARRAFGVVRTGATAGTFSIRWGNGTGGSTRIVHAGSFMFLEEAQAY